MGSLSRPIRVLAVFATLDRGGAETMCMNLYRAIDRSRVQMDFVKHTARKCDYEDEIVSLGGRVFTAPPIRLTTYFAYQRWWRSFWSTHGEIQVIHAHYSTGAFAYLPISVQAGKKTILHSHNTRYRGNRIEAAVKLYYAKRAVRFASHYMACSQAAGEFLFGDRSFDILRNAILTECYTFDPETRMRVREELDLQNSFVLGTVGNICAPKNPIGILKIYESVRMHMPDAKLLWVGSDNGAYGAMIKQMAEEHGVREHIIFAGKREDVPQLLQAMDVFIFPSLWEGLGIAAIEAQAAGLQCFCSENVPTEAGLLDSCYFLPLDDIDLWREAILRVKGYSRKNTQETIIEAGYDVRTTAKRMTDFYERIADENILAAAG